MRLFKFVFKLFMTNIEPLSAFHKRFQSLSRSFIKFSYAVFYGNHSLGDFEQELLLVLMGKYPFNVLFVHIFVSSSTR